ncbi:MAG: multidrug DMT transporter [Gammaproteobacteria bacterium]|nr:multidrug DMT transporter [Gammaproteobacteria bacterium]MBJ54713.1 multidrug DMT transporter [Gammaproteobacteria bacterium]
MTGMEFKTQYGLSFDGKINVDLFAGGGGASTGIEMGTNRPVHIAINHDPDAISQHKANHPAATHYESDVFDVDPLTACADRPVAHLHASPDCTHHSQASGGQPRKQAIRSLSWVVHRWAGKVRPDVITLENVAQILQWSPLVAKRCRKTGRVMKLDGTVAVPGERVPVNEQYLIPNKKKRGHNWRHFVDGLRAMGYAVEWKTLKACDYGAPTTRERLYLVARCDGKPIVWPEPTHAQKPKRGQKKWRTAADCIDWSVPGQSIFGRKRPLAAATMRRIAKGVKKYVLDASEPFIVTCNHGGERFRGQGMDRPLPTITAAHDAHGLVDATLAPAIINCANSKTTGRGLNTWGPEEPLRTITTAPGFSVATAYLAQMNGGFNTNPGHDAREPMSTITNTGSQQQLVTAHLAHLRGNCDARAADDPLRTISAGGEHHGLVTAFLSRQFGASVGQKVEVPAPTVTAGGGGKTAVVECQLSPEHEAGALRVAGFLMQYYGCSVATGLASPVNTITTKDRMALVTVWIKGDPYVIVDIRLRMLDPRELYRAQGFPDSYIIDRGHDGRVFPKYKQVRFVGNSVSPLPMAAIARANLDPEPMRARMAA